MRRNYIERCETKSTMVMQEKAWMTGRLFSIWISHFVKQQTNFTRDHANIILKVLRVFCGPVLPWRFSDVLEAYLKEASIHQIDEPN
jgi:hypothetical protein